MKNLTSIIAVSHQYVSCSRLTRPRDDATEHSDVLNRDPNHSFEFMDEVAISKEIQ